MAKTTAIKRWNTWGWALGALFATALAAPATTAQVPPPNPNFDMVNGNSAIEVVIPTIVPQLFQEVKPGDATIVLRVTTMATNAMFDATAPYDDTAVGVYSRIARQPAAERTNENINIAVFYASYHTMLSLFPHRKAVWDNMMTSNGLDPNDNHESENDPVGIGNKAATEMLIIREQDGMNQLGFEGGRQYNPQPYADYTNYKPRNTAYRLRNPSRWQPQRSTSNYGISRIQHFVTPQYANVLPYSFHPDTEFHVPPPKASWWRGRHKRDYRRQTQEVIDQSAAMTEQQKLKAELFDNKILSLGFSSLFSSQVNGLSTIEFVQYDFLANMAAFDTGIAIWRAKRKWDAVRPFSAIRFLKRNRNITAWGGPGQGTVTDLPADQWRSYLPVADHPEYPSASASFCAAHSEASRTYFGTDTLNWSVPTPAGSSFIEPGLVPAANTTLDFPTWTAFNEDCGDSRFWAGVHFKPSIVEGRKVGQAVASRAIAYFESLMDGTAPPFTPPQSNNNYCPADDDDDDD